MTDFRFLYVHVLAWLLLIICPFLLVLAVVSCYKSITTTFGMVFPPEFTQVSLHLLDHFFAPIPTPIPLPPLFLAKFRTLFVQLIDAPLDRQTEKVHSSVFLVNWSHFIKQISRQLNGLEYKYLLTFITYFPYKSSLFSF